MSGQNGGLPFQPSVIRSKQTTQANAKTYCYRVLRWLGSDDLRRSTQLGQIAGMSERQAEKQRGEREAELWAKPGRRDVSRSTRCLAGNG
jgi:hypothetical protein